MINDARGGHVSPGIYTQEEEVTYSVKNIGITSLGLAGETLKGPAFQPIAIETWSDFTDYFGGTSTEKYVGSTIPKYELPYIAKSYLTKSKSLQVVRVLGLSGYDAGIPYIITASASGETYPLVVLRSKGAYGEDKSTPCDSGDSEKLNFYVKNVEIAPYTGTTYGPNCSIVSASAVTYPLSGFVATVDGVNILEYYDESESGVTREFESKFAVKVEYYTSSSASGETTIANYNVSLNPYDKDYIYKVFSTSPLVGNAPLFVESVYDYAYNKLVQTLHEGDVVELGCEAYTQRYKEKVTDTETQLVGGNYKEPFRCAETPWIVSEVQAASEDAISLKKLFKFYTISDGNASNYQVKISIQNVNPSNNGTFDVLVRDFYDTDESPIVLERYTKCSMTEGDSSYIGLKIGTYDGSYEIKSKYVTVRINDEEDLTGSVPAGFLGYPVPAFGCSKKISLDYVDVLNTDVKVKRQYFGLTSDILDEDILNYKGVLAYTDGTGDADPEKLTNGFHLDSILSDEVRLSSGSTLTNAKILVDGVSGFTFSTVNAIQENQYENIPRIIDGTYMDNSLYADIQTRKFTVYPYGGFDGWDIYRKTRTNTDKYKSNKYVITGNSCPFKRIGSTGFELDPQLNLELPSKAITSDYYAYLGAYNQFMNPEAVDINIFATPGIDWSRNTLLVEDAIDLIEEKDGGRGGDAIYIPTAPQYDDYGNMLDSDDVTSLLDNSGIQSSYAATYFPWVKIYDSDAKKYVELPATKDVVRNMAQTDNERYPWFAPAGTERGKVDCVRACIKTKLGDEDTLYNGLINPIKTFASDGVLVWGNKTMYNVDTPTNRVNVRRLMIRVKKLVTTAAKDMIFDQYDEGLDKQFDGIVRPILTNVKSNRGIYDFKIYTYATEETRDQHLLPAKILIKPTPTLEYISITFTIYPESVDFEEQ